MNWLRAIWAGAITTLILGYATEFNLLIAILAVVPIAWVVFHNKVLVTGSMKNPHLAALLNIIPLGLGYLYLGRLDKFSSTLFRAMGALVASTFLLIFMGIALVGPYVSIFNGADLVWREALAFAAGTSPLLLLTAFTARDAWRLATAHNHARQTQAQQHAESGDPASS